VTGRRVKYDPEYGLTPRDGPYGLLPLSAFYERNPGLLFENRSRADALRVAFQPEIGSVSTPTVESLRRFMGADALGRFPVEPPDQQGIPTRASAGNATAVDAVWTYHKYLSYGGALAAYGPRGWAAAGDVAEYAVRAQLVQFQQLQALFEGFQVPAPHLGGCLHHCI